MGLALLRSREADRYRHEGRCPRCRWRGSGRVARGAFSRRRCGVWTDAASDGHPARSGGRGNGRSKDCGPTEDRRHEGHE
jgi:hypothetical protein